MRKRKTYDPYIELIDKLNKNRVKYVVIGMSGINYYASGAKETFATADFDIFVKPAISNVKKTLVIFKKLNYNLATKKGKLKESAIRKIVAEKKTILATDPYGITFELILAVSGYNFDQMEKGATIFIVEKIPLKVGALKKLLRSKKIAGREKDRLFLKRYELLLLNKQKT